MLEIAILGGVAVLAIGVLLYPLKKRKRLVFILIPAVLIAYVTWGGWFEWQAFRIEAKKQREAKALIESLGSTEAVIERLKARVAETPKDAKAWFLLGRVYASSGQWQAAYEAYVLAHSLDVKNNEYSLHYAESVWELNHQRFDENTRGLLKAILVEHPNQPDALAMLAYDAYTTQHYQAAVTYWERLLALPDVSTETASKLRQAIVKARQAMDLRG
jgi:cytochrome c-type biogenesis protein CcmH